MVMCDDGSCGGGFRLSTEEITEIRRENDERIARIPPGELAESRRVHAERLERHREFCLWYKERWGSWPPAMDIEPHVVMTCDGKGGLRVISFGESSRREGPAQVQAPDEPRREPMPDGSPSDLDMLRARAPVAGMLSGRRPIKLASNVGKELPKS